MILLTNLSNLYPPPPEGGVEMQNCALCCAKVPFRGFRGKILCICVFVLLFPILLQAQEFNAKVTVNSSKIQGTNKDVFTSLQTQLNDFLNSQRWSAATFAPIERIECSFAIEIMTNPSDNNYQATLTVSAKRPVFNSTFTTPLIYFRDTEFDFT